MPSRWQSRFQARFRLLENLYRKVTTDNPLVLFGALARHQLVESKVRPGVADIPHIGAARAFFL